MNAIESLIKNYLLPYLDTDAEKAKIIKTLEVDEKQVNLHLQLGFPMLGFARDLQQNLQKKIQEVAADRHVTVTLDWQVKPHKTQPGVPGIPAIKNIIAIASGKGGVGKSTTAVNLALALAFDGASVGVLDADIYGPSLPTLLGLHERPDVAEGKTIKPHRVYGLQVMSIGFLVGQNAAMIWRGPMVSGALQQLLYNTQWEPLDYLVVDLPPGTGDIQLTLAQKIPVSAGVIVTTPQDLALQDAQRALQMFNKVNIPVLGLVENMSVHRCEQCGHEEAIFGEGGGERFSQEFAIELLGKLPLLSRIRAQADAGRPSVIAQPESAEASLYCQLARRLVAKLSLQPVDRSRRLPRVVITKKQNGEFNEH